VKPRTGPVSRLVRRGRLEVARASRAGVRGAALAAFGAESFFVTGAFFVGSFLEAAFAVSFFFEVFFEGFFAEDFFFEAFRVAAFFRVDFLPDVFLAEVFFFDGLFFVLVFFLEGDFFFDADFFDADFFDDERPGAFFLLEGPLRLAVRPVRFFETAFFAVFFLLAGFFFFLVAALVAGISVASKTDLIKPAIIQMRGGSGSAERAAAKLREAPAPAVPSQACGVRQRPLCKSRRAR
jgi:hypothetical protein